jgi:hypothetical protein
MFNFKKKTMKKKKESLLIKGAKIAKKNGYEYVYSIVKNYKGTEYCHVIKIDDVLRAAKWIPAPFKRGFGWVGRWGVTKVPPKSISRQYLFYLAKKGG